MDSGVLLAAVSTFACAALAVAVALRRERAAVASTMLALLVALAVWNGGLASAAIAAEGAWRAAALRTAMLGSLAASGLWLLLALRDRWPRRFAGPAWTVAATAPACVYFVAALTDASHGRLFQPPPTWSDGVVGWSGLFAEALATSSFAAGFAGTALFALAALRLWRAGERRPAVALGIAVLGQPIATFAASQAGIVGTLSVAAGSLTLVALVLVLTALRYHVLEPPPLGHRQVIEHLRHGVLMASATGEILDHNAAARRLVGRVPSGWSLAETIASLAPQARRPVVRRALLRVESALEPATLQIETTGQRHLEVSARPIWIGARRVLGQVATLRDRTEEIRYAERALRTQRRETIGTLAAGVAHEVNNPLAFVRANLCEIARMSERVDAARREGSKLALDLQELGELAGEALGGLDRIQRAIADVRCLAGDPAATRGGVSLDVVVSDAVRLAMPRTGARIALTTRLAPDLPLFEGSYQLLVQALVNLLMNAQQALEGVPDARIEIETGAGEGAVWVRVRDNGPGVPAALRERIFEPFFSTGADAAGGGLGLAVAAGIARDHGGSLRAESCESGASFLLHVAAPSAPGDEKG